MPVAIGHRKIDDELDRIFIQSENIAQQEKKFQVHLTEVLKNGDPRTKNSRAAAAVQRELEGLFEQGVFEEVRADQLPPDAVISPSRMVYVIRNIGTLEELYKATLTVGEHLDWLKKMMIQYIANIRHGSVRTITSAAATKKWIIWFRDAVQAYIKADAMYRYIALKTAPEFNMPPSVLWRVTKYLYGLYESGDE